MRVPAAVSALFARLPGVRGLAEENRRLRKQLMRAEQQIGASDAPKALVDKVQHQLREAERRLVDGRMQAAPGMPNGEDTEWLRKLIRFEHYWYNAQKKLDLEKIETFGVLARQIRREGRTYLHFDRLYTLWQGVTALPPGAGAVAEVGAYKGGSAKFIAQALRARAVDLPFYVCDTFSGHAIVDPEIDGRHAVRAQFSRIDVSRVATYLKEFPSIRLIEGDIRETSSRMADEHQFGLVHIDVDVYPITEYCLQFFGSRVAPGATIVVDDYGFKTCPGVKRAVDEFIAANPRFRMLHLLTGQAVLVPLAAV